MAYDIFKGKTNRDWSCGSLILPAKQQAALFNKIDDVRYDVRRSSKLIQIGMLALTIFSLLLCAIQRSKQMLLSLSYLLLASMLPLLVSFGTYFVIQHSLQGRTHLKFALNTNSYQLWLKSVYFSAGGALIFLLFMLANSVDYVGIFFSLLSCISIPHVLSMHHFYERFSIHKGN